MKKLVLAALFVFLFVFSVPHATAGEVTNSRLMGLNNYVNYFSDNQPLVNPDGARIATNYFRTVEREVRTQFGQLDGNLEAIDTALEWALASYYSPSVIQIRPAEANAMLPANNPRQADLILGANVFQGMQILRFLGDTAAAGRHEGVLRFITDRGNVTRAEIETFYRNGIRELISSTVDEVFNRISFLLRGGPRGSYNAILTRSINGVYTLSYEDARDVIIELASPSLEALASAMRNNTADFNQATIDAVRTQAGLMPAVVLSDTALNEAISILVNFYINPSPENYNLVKDWYVIYSMAGVSTNNERYRYLQRSTEALLSELNEALKQRILADTSRQTRPVVIDRLHESRLIQLR